MKPALVMGAATPCLGRGCLKDTHCDHCQTCEADARFYLLRGPRGGARARLCSGCADDVNLGAHERFTSAEALDYDPTPYCTRCGAMRMKDCDCGERAEND